MLVVGAAQQVVGQQLIVGGAMVVEETDIGVYVLDGKGLVVVVAYIDAVEAGPHRARSPAVVHPISTNSSPKRSLPVVSRLQRYVKILEATKLLRTNFRYWSKKDWKMTE